MGRTRGSGVSTVGRPLDPALSARVGRVWGVMFDFDGCLLLSDQPSGLFFWGDEDGAKYRGSYFEKFPGVWVQGDWITETPRGAFVVHGRSDATLNRQGVRLGSADIYNALQHVPEVRDAMVLGIEEPGGGYYMPLFVVLDDGVELTEERKAKITGTIRERTSARHVPDEVIAAPRVPITHALKKVEVPVKKLFAGMDPSHAVNRGSLANPDVVVWYEEQARAYRARAQR
ncbi:hypothetical protein GCM10012320_26720 [Sinomonas cellulolyticus]|uniref:AMP-binding enzyme C-terminal domain-containing protein n=1 Tax=Sinomonas cellulolyticus TaxID=2801916 RepID=A0ABS1K3N5_9MICC|nr:MULTISPECIES: hypothetical protein [Sinomonas]MBL0706134.1 hypothetical protein [Sinomonas cellulolyticus]GHG55127.1 hypothetical protein GCM10012320_26720 [Sinomonas sp. KCTC 49339]